MDLRDYLAAIATGYRTDQSMSSPGHLLLRQASSVLTPLIAGGLEAEGSGGKGMPTETPWIGVFDPDETTSPQEGIYVVYIYSADRDRLVLTLNQGVTKLRKSLGQAQAIAKLRADVTAIRGGMHQSDLVGTLDVISLGLKRPLQRAYEAGNVCALDYDTGNLPAVATLAADLDRFLDLYQQAITVKQHLLLTAPGTIASPSKTHNTGGGSPTSDPLREFVPKSDAAYVSHMTSRKLVKSRRHETLVKQFGEHVGRKGLKPATNVHPRDMTLAPPDQEEWLVEAKVVYNGNATHAVREAIGQLLQYRHFLYPPDSPVRLLALFTEPVGGAYVSLLDSLGIATVWKDGRGWSGSASSATAGLL